MSFEGKVIDLKYKNCALAFGFRDLKDFIECWEKSAFIGSLKQQWTWEQHIFIANFKPKTNHKGELSFQRGGARIALCFTDTAGEYPGELPNSICKVNVRELKEGCRIFYADQRVIGEDIDRYIDYIKRCQIKYGIEPDINLPKVRYPLSDAEKKQRVNAGKGRTDALVEKDERIKELEARIEDLERDNVKLKEEADDALDKGIKYIQKLRKLNKLYYDLKEKLEKKEKKAPVPIYFDTEDEEEEKQFEI